MSYNNLCRKTENALHGYLGAAIGGGVRCFKTMDGIGVENLPDDRIDIVCPSSRPWSDAMDATSGMTNRRVMCQLTVRSRADVLRDDAGVQIGDARDRHDQHVGAVMDALYVDGLPAALNGIGIAQINFEQIDWPVEETSADGANGYKTDITFELQAHSVA